MTVNNVSCHLIAYGSFAPGGKNHKVFSGLPGEWKRGKILCNLVDPPDGIGPGEACEIEAWTIKFSDCQAELFTPEYEVQKRLLHERWTALDGAMGSNWARDQWRWWPEDGIPVVGKYGMIVVNIYVPLKHFPYLAGRDDVPSPDEADDLHGMWRDVKAGRKRYEWSLFIALIKDATPDQYEGLFGDLPGGEGFIRKLKRFYHEHRKGSGNLLWDGESEHFSLYVSPLREHAAPLSELIDLAKADVANRAALLRRAGYAEEAGSLEALSFTASEPPTGGEGSGPAAEALTHAADLLTESRTVEDHWVYCLSEACYGIAANYNLTRWLMSHWSDADFDFEPSYGLWKGGGAYEVIGNTCHVFRESSEA